MPKFLPLKKLWHDLSVLIIGKCSVSTNISNYSQEPRATAPLVASRLSQLYSDIHNNQSWFSDNTTYRIMYRVKDRLFNLKSILDEPD